jgi:hypothetical protein
LTEVSQGLYFVVIENEENQTVLRILRWDFPKEHC